MKKRQKSEKKKQKADMKRRKRVRSVLEWMEVEEINTDGILLMHNGKKFYSKGVELMPLNIFMLPASERVARIRYLASAIDTLYEHQLYFKFIKAEPDMITYSSRYVNMLDREQNPAIKNLIEMQINKLELFSQSAKEIKFYVMIQDDELHIDKSYDDLLRAIRTGWGPNMVKEMQYTDYQNVVKQEFENESANEYLFTHVILPSEIDYKGDDMNVEINQVTQS